MRVKMKATVQYIIGVNWSESSRQSNRIIFESLVLSLYHLPLSLLHTTNNRGE